MDKFFKLSERATTVKTEILAGIATFLTMAYIIIVNPQILSISGMSFSGVLFATVLVASISSILMGLWANLPFALAPGMGINALFTFTIVKGMGVSWETALGAVFISGLVFIVLSVTKVRTMIVKAIPASLRYSVAAGIGLFLTLIGLEEVGFIIYSPATVVTFGGITVHTVVFLIGLLLTVILVMKKIKGALIYSIIVTSIIAIIASKIGVSAGWIEKAIVTTPDSVFAMPTFDVFMKMDILSALSVSMIAPIFSLLFTDMFDSISTFLGVAQVANLVDDDGQPINVDRALEVDAVGTALSGLFGTSSATTFIESAAGVEEGGRTGLTAVVAGLCFLPFMFLSPLLSFVPAVATAPVLVIIGTFMMKPLSKLDWNNLEEVFPAFLALILIPLTYSITQGIIWGFLFYTLIKVFIGKYREVPVMLYIIDVFAVISLILPLI
ncbi:MAG: NCS2 family permease [Spirochaetes bacterium]|nr:NCS2 family permease [Spirochaetota bacterium]